MNNELKGTIERIFDVQVIGEKGFQKREFILKTEEQYAQSVSLEVHGDRVDILDPFKEGDYVTVGLNIRGRKWTSPQGEDKYFNTLVAWRIAKVEAVQPTKTNSQAPTGKVQPNNEDPFGDYDEDLPF